MLRMSHLTSEQRYVIELMRSQGQGPTVIGRFIGKHKSVISRELHRNCDKRSGNYAADLATRKTLKRHREKPKHRGFTQAIKHQVDSLLIEDYSPEQIAGWCKSEGIEMVSHERIYQYVWKDKQRGGKLHEHLRRKGRRYRKRGNLKDTRGILKDRVDIDHRPAIVEARTRFGDLEIDTIIGKNHQGAIVTINDRASGMLKMKKVERRTAENVSTASIELLADWKQWVHTITADNGKEFADHKAIALATEASFYFAKPYHSWERGSNENLNGLVRQYIPKKTDFETLTDEFIQSIENKLNNRPRKRHAYKNPIFVMNQLLSNQNVAFVT